MRRVLGIAPIFVLYGAMVGVSFGHSFDELVSMVYVLDTNNTTINDTQLGAQNVEKPTQTLAELRTIND